MPIEIVMPKWGLSMQEGTIALWLKREGEAVLKGEPIVEIETEKIVNVVESPSDGTLARILHPEGSVVPVTHTIALIAAVGERLDVAPAAPASAAAPVPQSREVGAKPPASAAPPAPAPAPGGVIRAMPAARKLAKDAGIDLAEVRGSGPDGTITKGDVEGAIAARSQPAAPTSDGATNGTVRAMPAVRKLAKDAGIDLTTIKGSGPEGMITKGDVEGAIAARSAPKAPSPIQKVGFYSEGHRLDGLLYTPRALQASERRPGVVLLVGYTYLKTMVMPDIAKALNAAGYVALLFDYRGFGESEGPRHRLIPNEQVSDARAALTFLADQPHVDPTRLAVVGISLGGAHAITTAALDKRVRVAVALEPPGDGERWLRSLRRHWEWHDFVERLARDRSERVRSGVSARVDPHEIVVPDPESKAFLDGVANEFPQMRCALPLESADALLEYAPEGLVERIAPRPLLIVHGDADRLVPVEEAHSLAARAGEGCTLEVLPGMGHFSWVMPTSPGFRTVADLTVNFLLDVLPVRQLGER